MLEFSFPLEKRVRSAEKNLLVPRASLPATTQTKLDGLHVFICVQKQSFATTSGNGWPGWREGTVTGWGVRGGRITGCLWESVHLRPYTLELLCFKLVGNCVKIHISKLNTFFKAVSFSEVSTTYKTLLITIEPSNLVHRWFRYVLRWTVSWK